jgi:hypothetical protein
VVQNRTLVARVLFLTLEGFMTWKLFGGLALATLVAGVLVNLKDIRRYIKISTM